MSEGTPQMVTDAIRQILEDIKNVDSMVGPSKHIAASKLEERCALLSLTVSQDEPEIPDDLMALLPQDQRQIMVCAYLTILSMSIVKR